MPLANGGFASQDDPDYRRILDCFADVPAALAERIDVADADDELGHLAGVLNSTFARLEAAFAQTPPNNGRIIRNLILGANYLQSHVLHFYHLAAPDYIDTTGLLTPCVAEFAASGATASISTDDGSVGHHGYVSEAFGRWLAARNPAAEGLTVYSCGPEHLMQAVAKFCERWGMRRYRLAIRASPPGADTRAKRGAGNYPRGGVAQSSNASHRPDERFPLRIPGFKARKLASGDGRGNPVGQTLCKGQHDQPRYHHYASR